MTVTLTPIVQYPLPGKVRFTVNCSVGNAALIYINSAPLGSKHEAALARIPGPKSFERIVPATLLLKDGVPLPVGSGDGLDLDADKGGKYQFAIQEITLGATTHGGGYDGDPDAYPTRTLNGAIQVIDFHVGERFETRLGNSVHGRATLVVYTWNDTIRQTTIPMHGVATPDIINPTSPLAEAAMFNNTVQTKLDALVGKSTTNLSANIWTRISEMRTEIADHMENTGGAWHFAVDTDNSVYLDRLASTDPGTPDGWAFAVRTIQERLRLHMSNGPDGTKTYHGNTSTRHPDYENLLASDTASGNDMSSVLAAIGDIYRAYEAHRVETSGTTHEVSDTVNTLGSGAGIDNPLLDLHKEYLTALRVTAPTVPDEMSTAAVRLPNLGFRKVS